MAVIGSVVYSTPLGGMGLRGGVQAVILNSTPKAGVAVSVKGLHRTLRVHVPAQSEFDSPAPVVDLCQHHPLCANHRIMVTSKALGCGCTNTFCTEPVLG